MADLYFFDLPVYRLAYKLYNSQRDQRLAKQVNDIRRYAPNYEMPNDIEMFTKQHEYDKYGPWLFNEVIAYIRLHFVGFQIRGEYFSAEKTRCRLSRQKVFTYRTHKLAPEIGLLPDRATSNAEIFALIKQYIENCGRALPKGRVIYDDVFMAIGSYIDWRGLLDGQLKSRDSHVSQPHRVNRGHFKAITPAEGQ